MHKLQVARRELALEAAIQRLERFDLLILDDLPYVAKDQAETSVLFELISARYEHSSLLITANQPFGEWGKVFPDPAMTLAAVDRLVHHATKSHLVLWKVFSKKLIEDVDQQGSAHSVILWGSKAGPLAPSITNPLHKVIKGGHPSPISPGSKFFCKSYFTCSNHWLQDHHVSEVDWNVTSQGSVPHACLWSRGKTPQCSSTCALAACN